MTQCLPIMSVGYVFYRSEMNNAYPVNHKAILSKCLEGDAHQRSKGLFGIKFNRGIAEMEGIAMVHFPIVTPSKELWD